MCVARQQLVFGLQLNNHTLYGNFPAAASFSNTQLSVTFIAVATAAARIRPDADCTINPAGTQIMKRIPIYLLILGLLLPACSNRSGGRTTMVVKPKNHHWWFNKKSDKGKKRTKMVKMRN